MRNGVVVAVLAALLATAVAGCSDGPKATPGATASGTSPGTLAGVVVDEAIRPLAGVNVTLSTGQNATTGTDGLFAFSGLDSGVYVVRAKLNGYADSTLTATVLANDITAAVRVVLIADASNRAYNEAYSHEGFVQCSLYWSPGGYRFAACGSGNVGSLIVCTATGGQFCLGDVTDDRYITVLTLPAPPQWLQTESFWDSTQDLGSEFYILIGSATPEQLQQPTSEVYNDTHGPSPLLATMGPVELAEAGIGEDAYFLSQTFAAPSDRTPCTPGQPCVAAGAVANQQFRLILHAFYGYTPTPGWRFSEDPVPPAPPPV